MNETKPRKKVGLALSGGFIRATSQIGVIEVLEENGIPIDVISGCSSGVAVGAAYAAGTLPQLKKRLSQGSRKEYWDVIFEPAIPKKGLLKGERNRIFFEEFVGKKHFIELDKELLATAIDLRNMEEVTVDNGPVSKVIQACTAVPGIFVPVEFEDKLLVDGANLNLIPSKILYKQGVDYVIAVSVSSSPNIITRTVANFKRLVQRQEAARKFAKNPNANLNTLQLMLLTFGVSTSKIDNLYYHAYPYDTLIRPELSRVRRASVSLVDYCIKEGRIAALEALPKIKRDLDLW